MLAMTGTRNLAIVKFGIEENIMGLDMYLTGKRYMSKYFDKEDTGLIEKVNEALGFSGEEDADYGAQEVTFRLGYWRKANAIHKWFVDKCQEGVDECQETYLSREQLQELADTCKAVLADKSKADELLPSASGFFFGGTDYDEWYFGDLEYTVERIEKILNDPACAKMSLYYQSSW
jgi:hypothetical protein